MNNGAETFYRDSMSSSDKTTAEIVDQTVRQIQDLTDEMDLQFKSISEEFKASSALLRAVKLPSLYDCVKAEMSSSPRDLEIIAEEEKRQARLSERRTEARFIELYVMIWALWALIVAYTFKVMGDGLPPLTVFGLLGAPLMLVPSFLRSLGKLVDD